MARLTKSDIRCVQFARLTQEHGGNDPQYPRKLAELAALARTAASGAERECNVPDYSADRQRRAVEAHAASMGMKTEWPGLWPSFKLNGADVRIPA